MRAARPAKSWWNLANDANTLGGNQQNPRGIQISNATNITLYKITFKNSPQLPQRREQGEWLTVWGIHIVTPYSARNTDGIDPDNATDVTITSGAPARPISRHKHSLRSTTPIRSAIRRRWRSGAPQIRSCSTMSTQQASRTPSTPVPSALPARMPRGSIGSAARSPATHSRTTSQDPGTPEATNTLKTSLTQAQAYYPLAFLGQTVPLSPYNSVTNWHPTAAIATGANHFAASNASVTNIASGASIAILMRPQTPGLGAVSNGVYTADDLRRRGLRLCRAELAAVGLCRCIGGGCNALCLRRLQGLRTCNLVSCCVHLVRLHVEVR